MQNYLLYTGEILLVVVTPLLVLYIKGNWPLRKVIPSLVIIPILWYFTYAPLHELSHTAGLYFLGLIAGIRSVVPVIDRADYLVQISTHAGQLTRGAFFQFLMMAADVSMAIKLYPNLQKQNASLALDYIGFRLVAAACMVIGAILLLLLLTLSQEFVKASAPAASASMYAKASIS